MQLQKILKGLLIITSLLFLGFQIFDFELFAAGTRVFLVLLLTILYCVKVQQKRLYFFLFLIFFVIAEMVNLSSWFVEMDYDKNPDYFYYGANMLYIISYIMLIFRVIMDMNLREVMSKFWIHLIVLFILDVFCVVIVSGTTEKLLSRHEYYLEFLYNSVIMLLLTVAMINYMLKNSQKSMNLLLGAIFIFFSEVIQMTYNYISDIQILNVTGSLFMLLAFLFLYLQSKIPTDLEQNTLREI